MVQSILSSLENAASFSAVDWLKKAAQMKASDVHFHSNYPPLFRLHGSMARMQENALTEQELRPQLMTFLSETQQADFEKNRDIDFTYEIPGVARYRASMFLTHSGLNSSFRVLPPGASTLEELKLPAALSKFTEFHHGLVLITGPAGSGKSTTLAALVNLINEHHSGHHILSLEDPIEIVHPNKHCIVNQRQVLDHTQSYARAMRAALREDPDVIIIGEMRDSETIGLALTAAETGHLVMASMHTTDAVKSISRIVDSFPPEKQAQIRTMLSESLQAVFSQLLLPTADGNGRVMAYELLLVTSAISNLMRDKKTFQIPQMMQVGRDLGMITLSQSIAELVKTGKVKPEVAKKYVEETLF